SDATARGVPSLGRLRAADASGGSAVVLDGAAAALRLSQSSGPHAPPRGGRQSILCRALGAAAQSRARSDRAAAHAGNAARHRIEALSGRDLRPDNRRDDLVESGGHRGMETMASAGWPAALQPNFL